MLAAALWLVTGCGSNVPSWDDWDMVPFLTGHQPITIKWLWSQHNEHRVLLPRLLCLGLMRLVTIDFRVGMYANVLGTGVLALALIFSARRLRGRSSFLDAFFPMLLLNWGQAANMLWCWQLQFYASMLLVGTILALISCALTPPKLLPSAAVGTCVLLLPLCGANGVGLVPALALWLGYVGVLHWRVGTHRGYRNAIILSAFALLAVFLVGLYFLDYHKVPYHPSTYKPGLVFRSAVQFITMGFGPGVVGLGFDPRLPMPFWKIVCAAIALLFAVSGWRLVRTWRTQPSERARAAGIILYLAAMLSLALGIGLGRNGFETRYVTLSVPALCAVYLAWSIYGSPRYAKGGANSPVCDVSRCPLPEHGVGLALRAGCEITSRGLRKGHDRWNAALQTYSVPRELSSPASYDIDGLHANASPVACRQFLSPEE